MCKVGTVMKKTDVKIWGLVAKSVARQLATAALWVRIQISLKIINGRHKRRSGQHTLALQKNIQKKMKRTLAEQGCKFYSTKNSNAILHSPFQAVFFIASNVAQLWFLVFSLCQKFKLVYRF
jgi:hypothetical protein